jgi:hypothetical protein
MDLRWGGGSLLGGDVFELDRGFIVWTSTRRTQSIHRRLDVVEAELAYLYTGALAMTVPEQLHRVFEAAYLVAARTRAEVPVGQVELLDA